MWNLSKFSTPFKNKSNCIRNINPLCHSTQKLGEEKRKRNLAANVQVFCKINTLFELHVTLNKSVVFQKNRNLLFTLFMTLSY